MMRIMAMRTKAVAIRQCRSKSRARRWLRLIHPMVRSTAQRSGSTTNLCLAQQRFGPIAVLHIGRMHDDREPHADGVGQQVALAADDLLARVVTRRIERRAPFCAAFAVWLPMIAVVGLASRPVCSRTAT
jgi:hypothetical protein